MTADEIFDQFQEGFARRKYTAGLLVAFIDFLSSLNVQGQGLLSFDALVARFPQETTTRRGDTANTLIVRRNDGSTVSLRSHYDAIERFFRADNKRFFYPNSAPFATGRWADFKVWLEALLSLDEAELHSLRLRVVDYVLATLESSEFDPASVHLEPPLFRMLLDGFDMTAVTRREPAGASYQGIVFGFLRADNPHLQIEIDKVGTGSKRLQRVADVDCWDGDRLAISAEVKQYVLTLDSQADLADFSDQIGRRGALGIVAALGFQDGLREELESEGLRPLALADMIRIVDLWDPFKQRIAVNSVIYYASHIQKNKHLSRRFQTFLDEAARAWRLSRAAIAELDQS